MVNFKLHNFASLPATILSLFGLKTQRPVLPKELYQPILKGEKPSKIILFLIDGLGFDRFVKDGLNYEFFRLLNQKGSVSPLTSLFPSTTAAAITTLAINQLPQEHGLFEWFVYFKEIDQVIATLPFSLPGEKTPDSLLKKGVDPGFLYQGKTIYQILINKGVVAYLFNSSEYAKSSYSQIIGRGGFSVPFQSSADLAVKLSEKLAKTDRPAYFYVYWDYLDTASHHFGPGSPEFLAELAKLSAFFHDFLKKMKGATVDKTLLILTADHGQIAIEPGRTIFLNGLTELEESLEKGLSGQPILPCGSLRDVFLHVKPEKLAATKEFLSQKLTGRAQVLTTEEALDQGLFGLGKPSQKFRERAGNLLILPNRGETVWYKYPGVEHSFLKFLGLHGGLSEEERLIPLAVADLSELKF